MHTPDQAGAPTWLVTRTEREGGAFKVGVTCRVHWWVPPVDAVISAPGFRVEEVKPGRQRVSGIVTVVARDAADEDHLDPVAAGQERLFGGRVRAATAWDAAHVILADETRQRRLELTDRVTQLLAWGRASLPDATCPVSALLGTIDLPSIPLSTTNALPPTDTAGHERTGRSLRIDVTNNVLWTVTSRGSGQVANCGDSVVVCHPVTPERQELVDDLRAEYLALRDWCLAGEYDTEAATILIEHGWTKDALREATGALSMFTARDAKQFVSRDYAWWVDHGWGAPSGSYGSVPAADALQLAEIGTSCDYARRLHEAGFTTLDAKWRARPPWVPFIRGRFTLGTTGSEHRAVTNDPALAQQFTDRNPEIWGNWEHAANVECVHVDPSGSWHVWSDGRFTLGEWLGEKESRPTLPLAAAEVITTLMETQNRTEIPHALRQRLLTATGHEELIVEVTGNSAPQPPVHVALAHHTVTTPDETIVLWRVVTTREDQSAGGHTTQVTSIHLDQHAARVDYAEQCSQCDSRIGSPGHANGVAADPVRDNDE